MLHSSEYVLFLPSKFLLPLKVSPMVTIRLVLKSVNLFTTGATLSLSVDVVVFSPVVSHSNNHAQ